MEDITEKLLAEEGLRNRIDELEKQVKDLKSELEENDEQLKMKSPGHCQTGENLYGSEEMYSSIFNHIGIGISVISPDMKIIYMNSVMKIMNPHIDVSTRPICYESFNVPPRNEVCSYCPVIKTFQDGKIHTAITDTPTEKGICNLKITSAPIPSTHGTVSAVIEVVEDVTEGKRAEDALRESERRFRDMLSNVEMISMTLDRDARITFCNDYLLRLTGWQREEILGSNWFENFIPPESTQLKKVFSALLDNQPPTWHYENEILTRSGERRFIRWNNTVLYSSTGEVIGTASIGEDITERKNLEKALAESEERYRKLVELSPDSVFIHIEGRFVFMNESGARLLGGKCPEELYGRTALDFVHTDQRESVRKRIVNAQAGGDNPRIEELLVRLDGSFVPVEMESVYFNYKGMNSVLSIARDISDRKKMQEEMLKSQKLESLGVLAGGIAHDFNNILTGILGNISLVNRQLDPSGSMARRLESCEKAAVRASELTQQLLTFARGGEPVRKKIDPDRLIRESAAFVLRGSNVSCEFALADDLRRIDADAGQISQVLHNILINAIQAMPGGGRVRITAKNEELGAVNSVNLPAGDYLKIVVEDQGCGIFPEILSRIFDPYFTTKDTGSGLGLASAYSIIKRHGGDIGVTSTVGRGSRFTLFLPAISESITDNEVAGVEVELKGSGKILFMDDEEIIRETATEILEFAGYRVESCADGRDAVERYRNAYGKNERYDAVIMDLTVPGGMGGKEAAGLILEIDPDAVLIVSSGYSNDPLIANHLQCGFRGAVVKPFSAGSLATEVQRLIGSHC